MSWFRSWGVLYRPVNLLGWGVTALALAFCINTFVAVDAHAHSVSDTLYGIFPFWAPTFLGWAWIAGRTSKAA